MCARRAKTGKYSYRKSQLGQKCSKQYKRLESILFNLDMLLVTYIFITTRLFAF
jgi:hypothetical protein